MYQNDQTDGKLEEVVAVVLLTDYESPSTLSTCISDSDGVGIFMSST